MAKKKTRVINVQGAEISLFIEKEADYISLTDISKNFEVGVSAIESWMRNRNTVEFLGAWERLYNSGFNSVGFDGIKSNVGLNTFKLSAKKWINETNAIGIRAKTGRYGGTYAHKDIAIQFCYWLSPVFQLYVIKEFQRLKEEEARKNNVEWNYQRFLTKVNYRLHTDTIKEHIIPLIQASQSNVKEWVVYAEEADLLNRAVFGQTAKQWREQNPEQANKGNVRDFSDIAQLNVLANLESMNAILIERGMSKENRFEILAQAAISQYRRLAQDDQLRQIEN